MAASRCTHYAVESDWTPQTDSFAVQLKASPGALSMKVGVTRRSQLMRSLCGRNPLVIRFYGTPGCESMLSRCRREITQRNLSAVLSLAVHPVCYTHSRPQVSVLDGHYRVTRDLERNARCGPKSVAVRCKVTSGPVLMHSLSTRSGERESLPSGNRILSHALVGLTSLDTACRYGWNPLMASEHRACYRVGGHWPPPVDVIAVQSSVPWGRAWLRSVCGPQTVGAARQCARYFGQAMRQLCSSKLLHTASFCPRHAGLGHFLLLLDSIQQTGFIGWWSGCLPAATRKALTNVDS